MAKYSLEFKMKVIKEYLSGTIEYERLAKKHHVKSNQQIQNRVNAYRTLGIDGLKRSRKNNTYRVDFKLKAITMYEESGKSYQDVANELQLNNPSLIARWRKEYHEQGIQGLSRKQGRPPLSKKNRKKYEKGTPENPSMLDHLESPSTFDNLEEANQRIQELEPELRRQIIKNEYLEMLRSLRQQEAMKDGQESSTSSDNKEDSH